MVSSHTSTLYLNNQNNDNAEIQKFLYLGVNVSNPAISCAEIFKKKPSTLSGYYWLRSANGSAVRVFCEMILTCKGVGGGWMQVAKLDMTNSSQQCPPGTTLRTDLPKRLCGNSAGPGCSSTIFSVHGIEYRHVCGKIIAYQYASTDAFGVYDHNERSYDVDGNYVDGIMVAIHVSTSGHLLQLLMRWEFHTTAVLASILTDLQHHHPALLGMTTFVILAV